MLKYRCVHSKHHVYTFGFKAKAKMLTKEHEDFHEISSGLRL